MGSFCLSEENLHNFVDILDQANQELGGATDKLKDGLEDVLISTRYEKLGLAINRILVAYNQVVAIEMKNKILDSWKDSEASLMSMINVLDAGEEAASVCKGIQEKVEGVINEIPTFDLISVQKSDEPDISSEDFDELEQVVKEFSDTVKDIRTECLSRANELMEENALVQSVVPLAGIFGEASIAYSDFVKQEIQSTKQDYEEKSKMALQSIEEASGDISKAASVDGSSKGAGVGSATTNGGMSAGGKSTGASGYKKDASAGGNKTKGSNPKNSTIGEVAGGVISEVGTQMTKNTKRAAAMKALGAVGLGVAAMGIGAVTGAAIGYNIAKNKNTTPQGEELEAKSENTKINDEFGIEKQEDKAIKEEQRALEEEQKAFEKAIEEEIESNKEELEKEGEELVNDEYCQEFIADMKDRENGEDDQKEEEELSPLEYVKETVQHYEHKYKEISDRNEQRRGQFTEGNSVIGELLNNMFSGFGGMFSSVTGVDTSGYKKSAGYVCNKLEGAISDCAFNNIRELINSAVSDPNEYKICMHVAQRKSFDELGINIDINKHLKKKKGYSFPQLLAYYEHFTSNDERKNYTEIEYAFMADYVERQYQTLKEDEFLEPFVEYLNMQGINDTKMIKHRMKKVIKMCENKEMKIK